MFRNNSLFSFIILVLYFFVRAKGANYTFEIFLDNPNPTKPDENLWATVELPADKTYFIVGYEPLVSKKVAHHLILQACTGVEEDEGELDCIDDDPNYLYAWARGAPALYLPPDVGFKFGKESNIKAVRLGVHFKGLENRTGIDMSHIGARILYTDDPLKKEAGVFLLKSSGTIEPNHTVLIDVACEIKEEIKLHPFAFRTHSHQLGVVTAGYIVHPRPNNQSEWILIGKKNPLLPQFFYPISENLLVQKGDILAARCTDFNFKNHTVTTGPRDEDEMCNFYFMYWTDDGKFPTKPSCGSPGPPEYTWDKDPRLNNIPDDSDNLPK